MVGKAGNLQPGDLDLYPLSGSPIGRTSMTTKVVFEAGANYRPKYLHEVRGFFPKLAKM